MAIIHFCWLSHCSDSCIYSCNHNAEWNYERDGGWFWKRDKLCEVPILHLSFLICNPMCVRDCTFKPDSSVKIRRGEPWFELHDFGFFLADCANFHGASFALSSLWSQETLASKSNEPWRIYFLIKYHHDWKLWLHLRDESVRALDLKRIRTNFVWPC